MSSTTTPANVPLDIGMLGYFDSMVFYVHDSLPCAISYIGPTPSFVLSIRVLPRGAFNSQAPATTLQDVSPNVASLHNKW